MSKSPSRDRRLGLGIALTHRVGDELSRGLHRLAARRERDDRGDVPGWVLVTLMTAGLVTALWVVAKDRLSEVFETAISSVTAP